MQWLLNWLWNVYETQIHMRRIVFICIFVCPSCHINRNILIKMYLVQYFYNKYRYTKSLECRDSFLEYVLKILKRMLENSNKIVKMCLICKGQIRERSKFLRSNRSIEFQFNYPTWFHYCITVLPCIRFFNNKHWTEHV